MRVTVIRCCSVSLARSTRPRTLLMIFAYYNTNVCGGKKRTAEKASSSSSSSSSYYYYYYYYYSPPRVYRTRTTHVYDILRSACARQRRDNIIGSRSAAWRGSFPFRQRPRGRPARAYFHRSRGARDFVSSIGRPVVAVVSPRAI